MMHVVWRPYYFAIKQFSLSDNNLISYVKELRV